MRRLRPLALLALAGVLLGLGAATGAAEAPRGGQFARIEYVIDGDTVALTNGRHVRLVQIDTPEVYFSVGAAAPYFYDYRRGRYAPELVRLARRARARHRGLWGRCPGTPWDPNHGVSTGPPR